MVGHIVRGGLGVAYGNRQAHRLRSLRKPYVERSQEETVAEPRASEEAQLIHEPEQVPAD